MCSSGKQSLHHLCRCKDSTPVLRAGCVDCLDKPIPHTKFAYLTHSRPYGCSLWACLAQDVQRELVKTFTHLPHNTACNLEICRNVVSCADDHSEETGLSEVLKNLFVQRLVNKRQTIDTNQYAPVKKLRCSLPSREIWTPVAPCYF